MYCGGISEIIPEKLFLSDFETAIDLQMLLDHEIKAVINISDARKSREVEHLMQVYGIQSYTLPCLDHPDANIQQYFSTATQLIKSTPGAVLVHCMAGISRSATLVVAYLMTSYQMTVPEALRFVKDRRPIIQPNRGFVKKLLALAKTPKAAAAIPSSVFHVFG